MARPQLYADREEAGQALAEELKDLVDVSPIVLAIPRGGVPVARSVADALNAPLDLILVRKLPIPIAPETAFGVIAEDGTAILDKRLVRELGLDPGTIDDVKTQVLDILQRYAAEFEDVRARVDLTGATLVLVDDGLATGYTMLGAVRACRNRGAGSIIIAAPVSSDSAAEMLESEVTRFVCPFVDPAFTGVSAYYQDFEQLTDEDVRHLLVAG